MRIAYPMAIIYEVNLKIAQTIAQEYLSWLYEHINEMLALEGFINAHLYEEVERLGEKGDASYIVQYKVASLSALQHYLEHVAPKMRQEGVNRFAGQFSVTRRILKLLPDGVFNGTKA
jgi:quinol monooxygenase YgiN